MTVKVKPSSFMRVIRHRRVRKKINGSSILPRLSVYRSLKQLYCQFIDDENGKTILSLSTLDKEVQSKIKGMKKTEQAGLLGEIAGKQAIEKGITRCLFDRGGFLYHGRVKAFADGIRRTGVLI